MNRLKQFRRIATRYDKWAITVLALLHIVAASIVVHEGSGHTFLDKSAMPGAYGCGRVCPRTFSEGWQAVANGAVTTQQRKAGVVQPFAVWKNIVWLTQFVNTA